MEFSKESYQVNKPSLMVKVRMKDCCGLQRLCRHWGLHQPVSIVWQGQGRLGILLADMTAVRDRDSCVKKAFPYMHKVTEGFFFTFGTGCRIPYRILPITTVSIAGHAVK